jgi:cytochrome c oxidase subunit 2
VSEGPAAARIEVLLWEMTILGGIVFVIFCVALLYAVSHRNRHAGPATAEGDRRGARAIVLLGAVIPSLVLIPHLIWTMDVLGDLDPRARKADLVVELVGRQWWWEARYLDSVPARSFITANELHIPVGRRVEVRLTSTDVIHSFWVPELQGKTDLIPGRTNVTWLEAERPGRYGGYCAEYCGVQHAHMDLFVVATPPDSFEAWATRQRAPAREPADSVVRAGQRTFLEAGCAYCHAVRGTPAGGNAGPDLTHVASRGTLAAGLLPNSPGHLAGWVANPQALKPGTRMPRVPLEPEAFRRLHTYLLSLE